MKLAAVAAVAFALAAPAAEAELVPGTATAVSSTLAVAPDGTPLVAAIVDGRLVLAARGASGAWADGTAPALPSSTAIVVGASVTADGRVDVLVEQAEGAWLALEQRTAAGWRAHVLVRKVAKHGVLGIAGLALDRAGRPVVAYATAYPSQKTWLYLVRVDGRGRFVTRGITRGGYPSSDSVPSAAPVVLPSGVVRVVETYSVAAIEWVPKGRDWVGQFLFTSPLGSPAGPAAAAPALPGVWSAWTELYPTFGESHILLTLHLGGEQTTVLNTHAFLVALAVGPQGPEVAADDYVDSSVVGAPPGRLDYAGLVVTAGGATLELGEKIVGYAVDAAGGRQFLLAGPGGLEWYRAPSLPAVQVSLTATPGPGTVALAGSVTGSAGGTVDLYRERPGEPPVLVATRPLAPDGSFAAADVPPSPSLYRAVYRATPDGIPFASLLRTPVQTG